jgi:hypothetical protein
MKIFFCPIKMEEENQEQNEEFSKLSNDLIERIFTFLPSNVLLNKIQILSKNYQKISHYERYFSISTYKN